MRHKSFAQRECAIARSLDQVGQWWSILILRDLFMGRHRFNDLREHLGIAATTLTRRLDTLIEHGMVERQIYDQHPARHEYRLTEKGEDFLPVLLCLARWGNRWLYEDRPAMLVVDSKTGQPVEPMLVDRNTGQELLPGLVGLAAGPGASRALRQDLRRKERITFGGGRESSDVHRPRWKRRTSLDGHKASKQAGD